jgi:hypothetical protein
LHFFRFQIYFFSHPPSAAYALPNGTDFKQPLPGHLHKPCSPCNTHTVPTFGLVFADFVQPIAIIRNSTAQLWVFFMERVHLERQDTNSFFSGEAILKDFYSSKQEAYIKLNRHILSKKRN